MLDWLSGFAGPHYVSAILWTLAALVLLVVVLLAVRLFRSMTAGTYVAGGRSRRTRLSVMDATAVDSHRRLVLVRRDDVEHLLLIGGPTDVVVERDIRRVAPRRPVLTGDPPAPPPPQSHEPPATRQAPPAPSPVSPKPSRPGAASPFAGRKPADTARSAPLQAQAANQPATPQPVRPAARHENDEFDDALLNELEASLGSEPSKHGKPDTAIPSLDDEMARLLGELSVPKR